MAAVMGKDAWWSVPLAVLLGVPMYTNAAGVIPIVQALLAKGAALGTVAHDKGVEIHVEKVEDIQDIMRYGIMSTPGVVIEGQVVHAGGVPSRSKVEGWLTGVAAS